MKILRLLTVFAAFAAFTLRAAADDVTVTLSEVHLCCQNCVKGANAALAPVTGAKVAIDMNAKTIALTAADKPTLQKAVDALTAAGYFGKSSDASIKVDASTGAKAGKVQTLEVSGVHLCCGKCVTAVKDALASVDGVKGDTVVSKAKSFTVTGDFDATQVFAALQKIGLTGKVVAAAN
jgi:copper chaperone CopZ